STPLSRSPYPWVGDLSAPVRAEPVSDPHQLGNRFDQHLAHDLSSVKLDGDEAQRELARDPLVDPSRRDELHNLLLALRELVVPRIQHREARLGAAPDGGRLTGCQADI